MYTSELMEQYCDGDEAAFRELYDVVAPKLLGYVIGLARDRAVAEDLVQQTFMKVHQARATYERGADPLPWIYTIARRAFFDHGRRSRRSLVRLCGADAQLPEIATDVEGRIAGDAPDGFFSEAAHLEMMQAVQRLPEPHRLALVTTKLEQRSMAEAATILGTTEGALKVRAHRAYSALRTILVDRLAL